MLLEILINLFFGIFKIIISIMPQIPVFDGTQEILNNFDFVFRAFSNAFVALSYIAGNGFIILLPFVVYALLLPIEMILSMIWFVLYKTHILGGGK